MIAQAVADAAAEGIAEDRPGDRARRRLPLPRARSTRSRCRCRTATSPQRTGRGWPREFPRIYERNYGEGTAWEGSPVVLMNLSIRAVHGRAKPESRRTERSRTAAGARARRAAATSSCLPSAGRRAVPVYAEAPCARVTSVAGPVHRRRRRHDDLRPDGATCDS